MRNLSMKKLGTPIGAGPGIASEVEGLERVGTPWSLRRAPAPAESRRPSLALDVEPVFTRPGVLRAAGACLQATAARVRAVGFAVDETFAPAMRRLRPARRTGRVRMQVRAAGACGSPARPP